MFELANYAKRKVELSDKLYLLANPQSLSICFIYKTELGKDNDALNLTIRENLMKKGLSLVNYGYLNGKVAIRLVISNPEINEKNLDEFFENFIKAGNELEHQKINVQATQSEKCLIIE